MPLFSVPSRHIGRNIKAALSSPLCQFSVVSEQHFTWGKLFSLAWFVDATPGFGLRVGVLGRRGTESRDFLSLFSFWLKDKFLNHKVFILTFSKASELGKFLICLSSMKCLAYFSVVQLVLSVWVFLISFFFTLAREMNLITVAFPQWPANALPQGVCLPQLLRC